MTKLGNLFRNWVSADVMIALYRFLSSEQIKLHSVPVHFLSGNCWQDKECFHGLGKKKNGYEGKLWHSLG